MATHSAGFGGKGLKDPVYTRARALSSFLTLCFSVFDGRRTQSAAPSGRHFRCARVAVARADCGTHARARTGVDADEEDEDEVEGEAEPGAAPSENDSQQVSAATANACGVLVNIERRRRGDRPKKRAPNETFK